MLIKTVLFTEHLFYCLICLDVFVFILVLLLAYIMFVLNNGSSLPPLNLITMATVIEANGPIYNGPGASKPSSPFVLCNLELSQRAAIEKAKKYAMEQSIRSVLLRQTQSQQSLQLNNIKKNQTVALLNRVYVGSIAYDVKEDSLKQVFSPFGPIKSVNLSWDPSTQKHKGFAFLEFEYPEAAQLAIDQMNGTSFGGRQLKVGRPSNLTNAEPVINELINEHNLHNRIYVAGIHLDLTEDDVSLVFEAFGKIVFCKLQPDPTRPMRHRGFGYIEYESAQSAADAVGSMNQFNLGGQLLRVCKAISPPDGISNASSSNLPPAAAVAAASATAKVLSMETEQLPVNSYSKQPEVTHSVVLNTLPSTIIQSTNLANSSLPACSLATVPTTDQPLDQPSLNIESTASFPNVNNYNGNPNTVPMGTSQSEIIQQYQPAQHNSISPSTLTSQSASSKNPNCFSGGVLILRNMVGPEDCDDELEGEVAGECSKYGSVEKVLIHQDSAHETNEEFVNIFVVFSDQCSVQNAANALNKRYFAGRQITAEPYDIQAFMMNDLSR
ncbi:Poly(U)-binding-splicing factor PUF60-B [Schistosoma japonicum]|nr:Poly(U)-binding-splicing factor PUF60-B [Schistosoma japonicum]